MEECKYRTFYKSYSDSAYVRRACGNHYAGIMGAFLTCKGFACQLVNLHKIMNIRQRLSLFLLTRIVNIHYFAKVLVFLLLLVICYNL